MEHVIITKEDVQEIVQSVKITFIINCVIVIFIFILNSNIDIVTQFLASQSIGLTIVTIIQSAKVLYPPFKQDYRKLYYFLPVPVLPASFIGINFLHDFITLPELTILVAIITLPVMTLFNYKDNKIQAKKQLIHEQSENSVSEKTLQENKLLLLQAQINPHFLFNTLDNIKQYILSEPKKAQHLLTDYTFFLRQTLPLTQTSEVQSAMN
ncbi:histidine kinase [Psychromonas hadalis]|uniref:histidine kinase n=1 Tax=Psychromonas hadalis TaxID=211669 RepID=UPI0003B5E218|nr:sensor histidine kinase [Psychromonas hadalis]